MTERDAEVVIAAAALFHCVGMSIHRADHEQFSLFLTADKLARAAGADLRRAGALDHRRRGVARDHLATAPRARRSRSRARSSASPTRSTWPRAARAPFELPPNIHSVSSYAIESVKISPGREKAVRIEIEMSNSAGIYQVDEGLGTKLRGTPLAEHLEVVARIDAEHEQRLVPVFRLSGPMTTTPRELFDRHVRLTEAGDLEGLLGQYHEDAVLLRFDRVVRGKDALREHYAAYLAARPRFKELLQVADTEDLVSYQAVIEQGDEEHRAYGAIWTRGERIARHVSGLFPVAGGRGAQGRGAG